MRRFAPIQCFLLFVFALSLAGTAGAVSIDPELAQLMAIKSDRERLPVLLVYEDPFDVSDMILELDKLDPAKRRKVVLKKLKKRALKAQQNARTILDDPRWGDQVGSVRQLYLAGAIVFDGSPEVVRSLADLKDAAVLYHDKDYDLISGVSQGRVSYRPDKAAPTDTVWSVKYIGADRVWNELGLTGEGIVVANIDTGVDLDHPDLADRLWVNVGEIPGNGIDDEGNGFVDDVHGYDIGADDGNPDDDTAVGGHGTHTAGTVAGDGTGGILTGVAPGSQIMAVKVWSADGVGGSLGVIWAAEQYAVENGARIITMSLGIKGVVPEIFLRNDRLNCNNIRDAGVLLVNSAGNDHFIFDPPLEINLTARIPAPWSALPVPYSSTGGVLSVGASGYKSDGYYNGSSQGPVGWGDVAPWFDWPFNPGEGLIKPDISAPGTGVQSTVRGGGYSLETWVGTSMACPHVAGVAALMLQKNPSLSPAGLDSLMELTSRDVGSPGRDNIYGTGIVDAFAAVSAVPEALAPNLSFRAVLGDYSGDGVIDPGQVNQLAIRLANVSTVAPAQGVTAVMSVLANEYVTVVDGSAAFSDIPSGGGKGDNKADPFLVEVADEAPQGYPFTIMLTVESGSFTRTYDIPWFVGLPDHRTHAVGNVFLTVTDQGVLGYMSQDGSVGEGMGVTGAPSNLFIGSFWAGTGPDYMCNRDYEGLGEEIFEWTVSNAKDDNGRVRDLGHDLGGESSDQIYRSIFHDGGHDTPLPLFVEQTSFASAVAPNDDFVILEYSLTNHSEEPVQDMYAGVFSDFDLEASDANQGGTDPERNLVYIYDGEGPYFGVALLDSLPAVNLTLIDNPTYVYPEFQINDQNKFDLISGAVSKPNGRLLDDWSLLASTVVSLEPGGSAKVVFAMLYGETLEDLQANADAAREAYSPHDPLDPKVPFKFVRLDQNVPNPFNPITLIPFELEKAGSIHAAVYNLRGIRVRTLMVGETPEGPGQLFWDGTDDQGRALPSGVYVVRIDGLGGNAARKMTLVR